MRKDIIEEAINLHRVNCFCKSFEILGPADRTLLYLQLYIGDCLARLRPETSKAEAQRLLGATSFALPGESAFPLNGMFPAASRESEALRAYLAGLRGETASRLLQRLYNDGQNTPNTSWLAFQKRKIINKTLS